MNKVLLIGRLARDPEVQTTSQGVKYARFSVAVDRPYINSQTNESQTDFIPCVAWNNQAEFLEKYLDKGALVSIEGVFNTSNYIDKNNQNVWRYEVKADRVNGLESRKQSEIRRQGQQNNQFNRKENTNEELQFENDQPKNENPENKKQEESESVPWELDLD